MAAQPVRTTKYDHFRDSAPPEWLAALVEPGVRVGWTWTCIDKWAGLPIVHGWPCRCQYGHPETCPQLPEVRIWYVLRCDCGTEMTTEIPRGSYRCKDHENNMAWVRAFGDLCRAAPPSLKAELIAMGWRELRREIREIIWRQSLTVEQAARIEGTDV